LSQFNKDGALIEKKSVVLNALKCFGISRLAVSKVEVLEVSMKRKHSVIPYTLTKNKHEIPTLALIDCRAIPIALMDQDFARDHQIARHDLKEKKHVEVIDGRPIE
jgi:hypothetical protein